MRNSSRLSASSGLLVLTALACMAAGPAFAQAQVQAAPVPVPHDSTSSTVTHLVGPGLPSVDASQNVRGTSNHQLFQVLGFSGQISAPVDSPYNADNTYQTFAGQPGRGATAVLAQSMVGAP